MAQEAGDPRRQCVEGDVISVDGSVVGGTEVGHLVFSRTTQERCASFH